VAWLTLPWGAVASFGVYKVVMWWQGLSISQDYASSMGVLGKIQKPRFLLYVKTVAQDLKISIWLSCRFMNWLLKETADHFFVLEDRTGVAAVLELGSEPLYILAQHLLLIKLRMIIEGVATFIRCVVTYVLLIQGIGLVIS
jgi:hypothetical protein